MKPELQKEVDQDVEFIQMKLGFMQKLKKIYQEMKEKEEKHLQFLMQTKRSPADSEGIVLLNRETDEGTPCTQKILIIK
ncbi:MAG: hypothetical protein LLG04_04720 [Parachlamydia sp.]|nr:hypothetical protein [Parachlamydia sp.]